MKIRVKKLSYADAVKKKWQHCNPCRQSVLFRKLANLLSKSELKAIDFKADKTGLLSIGKDEPCLFLMNHSSFTDLCIVSELLKDRDYHIVCTNDGFIGKEFLLKKLGCIPAKKFITDITLVKDMKYVFEKLKGSVVMFPEASYSFDGSETSLPESVSKFVKLMNVPVVMISTEGAFLRDPLYNCLQKREVKVTASTKVLFSKEEIKSLSQREIGDMLSEAFKYDHFRKQKSSNVLISEDFRADGLERVLYKCPDCKEEGKMRGKGIHVLCTNCGNKHELSEDGRLLKASGENTFEYVTDWYKWERECVKEEIERGEYSLDTDVNVLALTDSKAIYDIGGGHLCHTKEGFLLTGENREYEFKQKSSVSYSLYADYYWYEIGDMISIGDSKIQYYCFPKEGNDIIAAKARLATEELYKIENA